MPYKIKGYGYTMKMKCVNKKYKGNTIKISKNNQTHIKNACRKSTIIENSDSILESIIYYNEDFMTNFECENEFSFFESSEDENTLPKVNLKDQSKIAISLNEDKNSTKIYLTESETEENKEKSTKYDLEKNEVKTYQKIDDKTNCELKKEKNIKSEKRKKSKNENLLVEVCKNCASDIDEKDTETENINCKNAEKIFINVITDDSADKKIEECAETLVSENKNSPREVSMTTYKKTCIMTNAIDSEEQLLLKSLQKYEDENFMCKLKIKEYDYEDLFRASGNDQIKNKLAVKCCKKNNYREFILVDQLNNIVRDTVGGYRTVSKKNAYDAAFRMIKIYHLTANDIVILANHNDLKIKKRYKVIINQKGNLSIKSLKNK